MKRNLKKSALVLLLCWAVLGCAPESLVEFKDANFGVHFSHPGKFSTVYNPHGGANRVIILHDGQPFGGLVIAPAPEGPADQFIAAGKEYFQRNYGATTSEYSLITTPGGYAFHHLKVNATVQGNPCVIERYIHLRPKTVQIGKSSSVADISQAVLESYAGAFSFEFTYRTADYERLRPAAQTVIDTFTLAKQ